MKTTDRIGLGGSAAALLRREAEPPPLDTGPSPPAGARGAGAREATTAGSPPARLMRLDPRYYQIAVLGGLLVYGMARLGFDIAPARALLILVVALLTQLVAGALPGAGRPSASGAGPAGRRRRVVGAARAALSRFEPRSALISGLSLCLLLRTNEAWLAAVAAVVAVGSKFVFRVRGKHVFNPTNFAIVALILATGRVWVSPGQWGSAAVFAFLLATAGGLVVNRAARADVTWTFLACWVALIVGRSVWLGDPLAIPLHRLQSGALVLFAFFMISDPRTTPDSRAGRVLFAALVALGAYGVQFKLFGTNGLLWSLALCSLLVPALDRLLPGHRYQWRPGGGPETAQERTPS